MVSTVLASVVVVCYISLSCFLAVGQEFKSVSVVDSTCTGGDGSQFTGLGNFTSTGNGQGLFSTRNNALARYAGKGSFNGQRGFFEGTKDMQGFSVTCPS